MTQIIPNKYHPTKATAKEEHGTFNIYHYKDGTKLTVRKKFEKMLSRKLWELRAPRARRVHSLSANHPSFEWKIGKHKLVVRDTHMRKRLTVVEELELAHNTKE